MPTEPTGLGRVTMFDPVEAKNPTADELTWRVSDVELSVRATLFEDASDEGLREISLEALVNHLAPDELGSPWDREYLQYLFGLLLAKVGRREFQDFGVFEVKRFPAPPNDNPSTPRPPQGFQITFTPVG